MRLLPFLLLVAGTVRASLPEYDAAITADATLSVSKLTNAVTFTGTNSALFDFGAISGDATFEFIVQGTPSTADGYLAVGSNTVSNLRFEQWNNTGQMGMTQLGVADYLFTPAVPTPEAIRHITYVWNGAGTMKLYVDGALAGTNSGVTTAFGMPTGSGRLGANPGNGEGMVGTIYRMTCYDSVLPDAKILSHADAYHNVLRPPVISLFNATPPVVTAGSSVQLNWMTDGTSVTLNGADVTGQTQANFTQNATTTYTLAATNAHGTTTRALTVPVVLAAGHVIINEFMAENKTTLADEDGDFSDWLELHNPTASPVNLGGLFLTDNAAQPQKWALPAVSLGEGQFKLVFLSSKNRAPAAGQWHTSFRLNKDGEYLALTDGAAAIHAYAPEFPPQDEDVSFGLTGADPSLSGFMANATPGAANDPTPPLPARVEFSAPSGILSAPLAVTLTSATPGAVIYYRLNNAAAATLYTVPLNVTATTRITAWAERYGQRSVDARASWMKPGASLAGYSSNLPIMVIDNFSSGPIPQKGWSGTGAGVTQVPQQAAAWAVWERVAGTATLSGPPQMASQIGIRGRGAFSSTWRQKPYAVEAWTETGGEKEVPVLTMPAHSDWVLYFPDPDDNKDPSLLFNTFLYQLAKECGHDAPRFRWVELFVNEDGGDLALTDRRGVYAVLEKVSRGRRRLDFEKLSADGSTGGWITNINRMDAAPETGWPAENGAASPQFFRTAGPNRLQQTTPNNPTVVGDDLPQQSNGFLNFDNPGGYSINTAQRASIEGWFRNFEDVLYSANWRDPVAGYRAWLDDRDFAEYFVFNEISRNGDGMLISMFPWKGDDGRLRMGPVWDYNWASYQVGGTATGNLRWRSNQIWYTRLFTDPDFMQLYIDRWFAFRRGPMSNAAMNAIIDAQGAEITGARAMLNGVPSAADFTTRLTAMKTWLTQRGDWVDGNYLRPPVLSPAGGIVTSGQTVTLTAPAGTIYRKLDGTDPRPSGGVLPVPAPPTGNTVPINADTKLFARAHTSGTTWSASTIGVYVPDAVAASAANLVVSEILYHPAPPSAAEIAAGFTNADDFEFVELLNPSAQKVSLAGVQLVRSDIGEGVGFAFNDGSLYSLAPGARAVVVKNRAAFTLRYGSGPPIAGEYAGRLDNDGDLVTLKGATGSVLTAIAYDDACPWPAAADGDGYSLTFAGGAQNDAANWRTSIAPGGTPGSGDSVPFPGGNDLIAYALGGHAPTWQRSAGSLIIQQRRVPGTDAALVTLETSTDLVNWPPTVTCAEELRQPDGAVIMQWTVPDAPRLFIRFQLLLR